MSVDVTVIVLTYNEEANLPYALDSVCGWAKKVCVFDSFSSDKTVEIAKGRGCEVMQNRFENYGQQRNAALSRLPIGTEWVFFLDADEWLTSELKSEIAELVASNPEENGFYVKFRLLWMGAWIRRGYYPTWILRLFRHRKARCEERGVNEHMVVEAPLGFLDCDIMHEDRNGLGRWIEKHNLYAAREAEELHLGAARGAIAPSLLGSQAERKRWIRENVWKRLPPVVRPFLYFGWRYGLRGGFLDGRSAFAYHFMQGLWFNMLIDLKYLELKRRESRGTS